MGMGSPRSPYLKAGKVVGRGSCAPTIPVTGASGSATRRGAKGVTARCGAPDPAGVEATRKWGCQALEDLGELTSHGTRHACQQWHKFHHHAQKPRRREVSC